MNNQTINQQRELKRFEDLKGHHRARELPWFFRPDFKDVVRVIVLYTLIVLGMPLVLNWFFNWLLQLRVFL